MAPLSTAKLDGRRERREHQPRTDRFAERVADDESRLCVHDRSQIDEAAEDCDIGYPSGEDHVAFGGGQQTTTR